MRPIEYRTDVDFQQALRCAEYRPVRTPHLKGNGLLLAYALRYGVVGSAAIHHLLITSDAEEERLVLDAALSWARVVSDHFRHELAPRLEMEADGALAAQVGQWSQNAIQVAVPLYRRLCPLEVCLTVASEDFALDFAREIRRGWNVFLRGRAQRAFEREAEASVRFALGFYERRRYDLDEVPEIALLGE